MKKTQNTYLRKTIQKNIVSFLAVALMVATGVSIYLGDRSSALAILHKADDYFRENRLQSLQITCAYGITQEDIESIALWENVDAAEGGYSTNVMLDTNNGTGNVSVQAHALLETMNIPVVVEGTLPKAENEAGIEQKLAEKEGISVGDSIYIDHDGELRSDVFVVTAIINEPAYCCATAMDTRGMNEKGIGSNYYYIGLPKAAFDASYYDDCYTTAYIRNDDLDDLYYFSEEYKEQETAFIEQIEMQGMERAGIRFEDVKRQTEDALEDARAELEEYTENLDEAEAMLTYMFEWAGISGNIEEAKEQLEGYGRLKEPLLNVIGEYEDGMQKLADGWEELAEAEDAASKMEQEDWVVSGRSDIGDVRSIEVIVEGLYGLSYSMALIFVIVSITVCYAAISRMISEQRAQIGMQKALGFTTKEILEHYMKYSVLCVAIGILQGWFAAFFMVQALNLHIYKTVFLFDSIPHAFSWTDAFMVSIFFMVIFMISAYAACVEEVRMSATDLLRGEVPEREKPFLFENWKGFQRMRLYSRTMIKNVFADRSRLLTTIMGVAGCTTLLVICFTLLIAMKESSVVQFEDYFLYQNRLVIDTDAGETADFAAVLEEENIPYTVISDKLNLYREEDADWSGAHLVVVSDADQLNDFMVLQDPYTKEEVKLPEEGVLVSVKCAEDLGLEEGSVLQIMDSNGEQKDMRVSGVIEHYLGYNLFVTSDDYYEKVTGKEADKCVFLLKGDISGLYTKVKDRNGFISLRDNSEYDGMGDVMNMIVMVCFVFAAVMAVLVMLNQNVMHINRKAKELSVMRINGFTMKETKAFVSRDNFLLTALGIVCGWGCGAGLGYWVIRVLEVSVTHYVRTPSFKACLIAAAICGIFAFLMNQIALKRIQNLNLTNVSGN